MWNGNLLSAGLALLLLSQPPHCIAGAPAETRAVSLTAQASAPEARRQGPLYRISHGGQTSYLFGTVHVGTKAFYPLAPAVSRALADSTRLVVELDIRANDAFQRAVRSHASYPAGDDIRKHVAPATLAALTEALNAAGISITSVAQLKPWLLANLLMGLELHRNGFERDQGLETFLLANAQTHGTDVAELESADYQLSLFDTLDDADSESYLLESLRDLSDGSSLKKAKTLINAWSSGDPAALDAAIADATDGAGIIADFTRRTLLGRRNLEMAARIERIMRDSKTTFVGVGLLHLLGENGLPQLLSQRGYQVERMD